MPPEPSKGMSLLMAMPEKKEESGGGMPSIPIPAGFQPPDDVGDGESFDVTCRVYVKDGKLCVEEVNGVGTTEEEKMESEEEKAVENEAEEYEDTTSPGAGMTMDEAIAATKGRR